MIASGSVREAARVCGKSAGSAYKLRAHENGAAFRAEWIAAVAVCTERVRETAMDRAFTCHLVPVFWRGEQVGEKRVFNDRLLIALMRLYDAPAYHAERAAAVQVKLAQPPAMTQAEYIAKFNEVIAPFEREAAAAAAEKDEQARADVAATVAAAVAAAVAGRPRQACDICGNIDLGLSKACENAGETDESGVSKGFYGGGDEGEAADGADAGEWRKEPSANDAAYLHDAGWSRPVRDRSGASTYPSAYPNDCSGRSQGTHDDAAAGPRVRSG